IRLSRTISRKKAHLDGKNAQPGSRIAVCRKNGEITWTSCADLLANNPARAAYAAPDGFGARIPLPMPLARWATFHAVANLSRGPRAAQSRTDELANPPPREKPSCNGKHSAPQLPQFLPIPNP